MRFKSFDFLKYLAIIVIANLAELALLIAFSSWDVYLRPGSKTTPRIFISLLLGTMLPPNVYEIVILKKILCPNLDHCLFPAKNVISAKKT